MEDLTKPVEESETKPERHRDDAGGSQAVSPEIWAGDTWTFDELMKDGGVVSAFEEMVRTLREGT